MQFRKASKEQAKLRMALIGPAGSGKTYTALSVGSGLGSKIAVIDTERGSASKYAGIFNFDTLQLESFSPANYILAIQCAQEAGYDVLIIDSLSHEWNGIGGALEMVDRAVAKSSSGNSYAAWRDVTPQHNKLTDAIIASKCHIIATMRSKTEYVLEPNEKGKMVPRKVGMAAIQRDGLEYEFDIVGEMNMKNGCNITKTRCPSLVDGYMDKPGADLAKILNGWLTDGAVPAPKVESKPEEKPVTDTIPGPEKEAPAKTMEDVFTIKGVLEDTKEKDGKYGIKILGKKQYFVTFAQPAFIRALEFKGKRVEVSYKISEVNGKQQFDLQGIKEEK